MLCSDSDQEEFRQEQGSCLDADRDTLCQPLKIQGSHFIRECLLGQTYDNRIGLCCIHTFKVGERIRVQQQQRAQAPTVDKAARSGKGGEDFGVSDLAFEAA